MSPAVRWIRRDDGGPEGWQRLTVPSVVLEPRCLGPDLALPPVSCVILGNVLDLSVRWFVPLNDVDRDSDSIISLL